MQKSGPENGPIKRTELNAAGTAFYLHLYAPKIHQFSFELHLIKSKMTENLQFCFFDLTVILHKV